MSTFTRPVMGFSLLAFGRLGPVVASRSRLVVGSPPLAMIRSCAFTALLTLAVSAYVSFGIFGLTAKQPLLSTIPWSRNPSTVFRRLNVLSSSWNPLLITPKTTRPFQWTMDKSYRMEVEGASSPQKVRAYTSSGKTVQHILRSTKGFERVKPGGSSWVCCCRSKDCFQACLCLVGSFYSEATRLNHWQDRHSFRKSYFPIFALEYALFSL